jgi:hypothetical protein
MPLHFHHSQACERCQQSARILSYQSSLVSAFVFRLLFPYGISVTRRGICEPLSDNAFDRTFGALHVIYAKPGAVAIAEIEFRKIAMQVLLLAVLVHPSCRA